jgi:hypothetical protein
MADDRNRSNPDQIDEMGRAADEDVTASSDAAEDFDDADDLDEDEDVNEDIEK